MENLDIWNKVAQPPPSALRTIGAGRLKGKTDINPQWRYKAMTEHFGICGIGWKYEVLRVWNEEGVEGQIFAFAEILLYVKVDDKWSDGIPGIGGSMLVAKEQYGLHGSDEGYKMAITDALSVAMKMLGIASDVYAGLWDGSKYKDMESKPLPKMPDIKTPEAKAPEQELPIEEEVDTTTLEETEAPQESTPSDVKSIIDEGWFFEKMKLFQDKGLKKWSNAMVLKSLNALTGRTDKMVAEALKYLTPEQADAITISILETEKML